MSVTAICPHRRPVTFPKLECLLAVPGHRHLSSTQNHLPICTATRWNVQNTVGKPKDRHKCTSGTTCPTYHGYTTAELKLTHKPRRTPLLVHETPWRYVEGGSKSKHCNRELMGAKPGGDCAACLTAGMRLLHKVRKTNAQCGQLCASDTQHIS